MKKITAFLLTALIALSLFGCNKNDGDLGKQTTVDKDNGYTLVQEVKPFKFSEEEDNLMEMKGLRVDGFKVPATEELENPIKTKDDVLKIALQEVTAEYNTITIYFDRTRGFWKVIFSTDTEKTAEDGTVSRESTPKEAVYIDEDGYTFLCVTY